jgi:hypothetical protein
MWIRFFLVATLSAIALLGCLTAVPAMAITNTHTIEGYSNVLSVSPGGKISFSIHLPSRRKNYTVEIFRFGAQQSGPDAIGQSIAGPFNCSNGHSRSFDENQAYVNGAGWPASFSLKVPTSKAKGIAPCTKTALPPSVWTSGIYAAKITDVVTSDYYHITFVVKDVTATRKSIAFLVSTNTWTAYNFWPGQAWGGSSIYDGCGSPGRFLVTFLRPNPYASPETHDEVDNCPDQPYWRTEHLAAGALRAAHWLEANNHPYSMLTDYDLDTVPGILDPKVFKTLIINTHSEYWSQNMYNAVMQYEAKGGNVIDISGNTVFWQVILANSGTNLTLQKLGNWTPQQQAQLHGLGSFSSSGVGDANCTPYDVLLPYHWAFQNTGGQTPIGSDGVILGTTTCLDGSHGASGWEVDRIDPSLHVFAREYSVLGESRNDYQHGNMLYMRRASAGQVFSGGSITFGQSMMVDQALGATMETVVQRFGQLSFSDFSSDGHPDVVGQRSDGTLWFYPGNGVGALGTGVQFAAGWGGYDQILAPGDFDGDGKADLIARDTSGNLWLFPGTGNGNINPVGTQIGVGFDVFDSIIAPGDFDGDGYPDLLARLPDGTLWLYSGTPSGTLTTPNGPFDAGWNIYDRLVASGDFDEDGHPDVLARKPDGTLWLYRGNGHGGFIPGGTQIDSQWNQFVEILAAGDFNGDGHADIIARKPDGTLWLYPGAGNGTFQQNAATQIGTGWDTFNIVVGVW